MVRRIVIAAALGLMLGVAAACAPAPEEAKPTARPAGPQYGGTPNFRVRTDPFDWDPSIAGKSDPNHFGIQLASDTLLRFKTGGDAEIGQFIIEPNLAERWETPDSKTFTFNLRKGAKFHN